MSNRSVMPNCCRWYVAEVVPRISNLQVSFGGYFSSKSRRV